MSSRTDFDHSKLQGTDADIETALKEYGLAWIEGEQETLFYYGIGLTTNTDSGGPEYDSFDFATMENDTDIRSEYDFADFDSIADFCGMSLSAWFAMPLPQQISDMLSYYGYENIFGSSYGDGLSYDGIVKE